MRRRTWPMSPSIIAGYSSPLAFCIADAADWRPLEAPGLEKHDPILLLLKSQGSCGQQQQSGTTSAVGMLCSYQKRGISRFSITGNLPFLYRCDT